MSRQIIGRQFYLKKKTFFRLKKKAGPGQIRTQENCRPRHIRYLQAKLTRNDMKIEYIMNQGSDESRRVDESCGQSCLRENSLVPGCNNLAYRKGKKIFEKMCIQFFNVL